MKLSFDDNESFKEAVESLRFNNPASDSDARHQMESRNSMPLQDSERDEDSDRDNIIPSDPIALLRVESSSNLSIQQIGRSGDSRVSSVNSTLASNPDLKFTSAAMGSRTLGALSGPRRSEERSEDHASVTEKYLFPSKLS